MDTMNLSRREKEKIRQRHEILEASLKLFAEKGYQNVSMHEIAEKSEFAIGTLYKFFQNKEELYKALVFEQSQKFHEAIIQALAESDDEFKKLHNFVRAKGEVFSSNLPFIRLYLAENRGASFNIKTGMDEEVRKGYCETLDKLAAIFACGIKSKRFKKIADPYYLAVAFDSVVNAFLLLWLEEPERHPYPENSDTILNIFFKGLVNP